jgi:hypothetical protein
MVVYAAIVGTGDCAQFNTSILNLEDLNQLGTMRGQPVLKVDACKRCWELAQIRRRCTDKARELPEALVGRHKRHIFAGQFSASRSALSRFAPTRIAALSAVRVRLRSARPRTPTNSSERDKYRSSAGRENHSDDTRPIR